MSSKGKTSLPTAVMRMVKKKVIVILPDSRLL